MSVLYLIISIGLLLVGAYALWLLVLSVRRREEAAVRRFVLLVVGCTSVTMGVVGLERGFSATLILIGSAAMGVAALLHTWSIRRRSNES